jgi:hypothetical protein
MPKIIKSYLVMAVFLASLSIWFFWPILKNTFLYHPLNGDIIFQSLPPNPLVNAIEGITESPFSHCGMVYEKDGKWYVLESLGTVHWTSLSSWMIRGRNSGIAVYRPKFELDQLKNVLVAALKFEGTKYDAKYEMEDEKIYCSELAYKAFKIGIGIELGELDKLGDLKWQMYEKTIIKYEDGPVPLDRQMITPVGLTRDDKLNKVFSSF